MHVKVHGLYANQWRQLGDNDILNVTYRTAWKVMIESSGAMRITPEIVKYVARQVAMHPDASKLHAALGGDIYDEPLRKIIWLEIKAWWVGKLAPGVFGRTMMYPVEIAEMIWRNQTPQAL